MLTWGFMTSIAAFCHAVFCWYHLESLLFSEGKERNSGSQGLWRWGTRRRGGMASCDQDMLHERRTRKKKRKKKWQVTLLTNHLSSPYHLSWRNPRGLLITPTYLLDWQAVRHSLNPKAIPFCIMHVPIFVPKMNRDLLIHFREEQMTSVP